MRLSGLNHHSRALIALLIGSLFFITGCAGINVSQETEVFHPEFYAAKKLDSADIVKLRQLASSANPYVSSAATLLLGNYYLKYGNKSYGKLLINKSWNAKEYGRQMQLFGKLWKMDAYVVERDMENARTMLADIKNMTHDDIYMRTLKIYCTTAGLPAVTITELASCIDSKAGGYATDNLTDAGDTLKEAAPGSTLTYEEFVTLMGEGGETLVVESPEDDSLSISPDETINIVGADANEDEIMGMMYAISQLRCSFKMNNISENAAEELGESGVVVRLSNMQVSTGALSTTLGIDWNELMETAGRMTYVSRFDVVMIAASEAKVPLARLLQVLYKERGIESVVFSFNHPSFQANLRSNMGKHTGKNILLAGIGSEEELQSFAGIAKFLQTNTAKEKIMLITSAISDVRAHPEFSSYYKDVLILTPIQTVNDAMSQSVSADFNMFFGKPMNARTMQGYDSVVYLKNLTGDGTKEKFISNISEIYNEKAIRPIGLFVFNKQLVFKELQLDLIERPVAEEYIETEVQQ